MSKKSIKEGSCFIKSYSDLDSNEDYSWGSAVWEGKKINIYTDQKLINQLFVEPFMRNCSKKNKKYTIVDFAGGDGYVINSFCKEISGKYHNTDMFNLDVNEESLKRLEEEQKEGTKSKKIKPILEDLLNLPKHPVNKNIVDHGILRFALPYFSIEKQKELVSKLYATMKTNGEIIIFHDATYDTNLGKIYNDFFNEINNIFRKEREYYYTPLEELIDLVEGEGFVVKKANQLNQLKSLISPQAYDSRFQINQDQLNSIKSVFLKYQKKLDIKKDSGTYLVKRPLVYCIISK